MKFNPRLSVGLGSGGRRLFILFLKAKRRIPWICALYDTFVAGPSGLKRRYTAARLLRSWVRIPPGWRNFVFCECCVLSGRGLCDEMITRPEESYRLWCVVVCDLETSRMSRPWPALGRCAKGGKKWHVCSSTDFCFHLNLKYLDIFGSFWWHLLPLRYLRDI